MGQLVTLMMAQMGRMMTAQEAAQQRAEERQAAMQQQILSLLKEVAGLRHLSQQPAKGAPWEGHGNDGNHATQPPTNPSHLLTPPSTTAPQPESNRTPGRIPSPTSTQSQTLTSAEPQAESSAAAPAGAATAHQAPSGDAAQAVFRRRADESAFPSSHSHFDQCNIYGLNNGNSNSVTLNLPPCPPHASQSAHSSSHPTHPPPAYSGHPAPTHQLPNAQ